MKKSTVVKLAVLSTAATAVAAFAAGVAYELHTIKKLTVDIDTDEEETPAAEEAADEKEVAAEIEEA